MHTITITLDEPIGRLISHASRSRNVSPQRAASDLLALGFKAFLNERYRYYRRGEISFGRLAEELGMTTWELSHLLEDHGWPASNLPTAEWPQIETERQPARVAEDDVIYDVADSLFADSPIRRFADSPEVSHVRPIRVQTFLPDRAVFPCPATARGDGETRRRGNK